MELGNILFGNSRGKYPLPRNVGYEHLLITLLEEIITIGANQLDKTYITFSNDTFELFPYYWGDCTCGADESEADRHENDCLLLKPNFYYKPLEYKLSWYKYPLRDSYANKNLTLLEFADIIKECIKSL